MTGMQWLSLVAAALLALSSYADAQVNSRSEILGVGAQRPPASRGSYLGAEVVCSYGGAGQLPPGVNLYGADEIDGASPVQFLVGDQTGYGIWTIDDSCNLTGGSPTTPAWTTALPAGTFMTGLAHDRISGTYWVVDLLNSQLREFTLGTGTATANLPVSLGPGLHGGACIIGTKAYVVELFTDTVTEVDVVTGNAGCSFQSPDGSVSTPSAFGEGVDDAVDTAVNGATLVMSAGVRPLNDDVSSQPGCGVVRVYQVDCNTLPDDIRETWEKSAFPDVCAKEIVEFVPTSAVGTHLLTVGNATSKVYIVRDTEGIDECQGRDRPAARTLFVNSWQHLRVPVDDQGPMLFYMDLPPGANGTFAAHLNAGVPDATTITSLGPYGDFCFPLTQSGTLAAVWNNIGVTNTLGTSNYFGLATADPPLAPTLFEARLLGDAANFPVGSQWTLQGVVHNPNASFGSHSITNAIIVDIDR